MPHILLRSTIVATLLFGAACERNEPDPLAGDRETAPVAQIGADQAPASEAAPDPPGSSSVGVETPAVGGADLPASPDDTRAAPPGAAGGPPASASAPATSAPATGSSATDVLERAERTYADMRSMQANFVQEVYVPLLESTQHSRGTLFHRAPDRFLMRFSDPEGDIVVADGQYIWMYYPSTDERQVVRAPLAAAGQQVDLHKEFLSDATSRYTATRTGSETVTGRQTHALTLVPRGASPYARVRLWIDAQNNLVRRFEITEENGTVRKLEMTSLRPNAEVPESMFRFTPPPGTQVHDF